MYEFFYCLFHENVCIYLAFIFQQGQTFHKVNPSVSFNLKLHKSTKYFYLIIGFFREIYLIFYVDYLIRHLTLNKDRQTYSYTRVCTDNFNVLMRISVSSLPWNRNGNTEFQIIRKICFCWKTLTNLEHLDEEDSVWKMVGVASCPNLKHLLLLWWGRLGARTIEDTQRYLRSFDKR